jgi:hypothetical protein
MSATPDHPVRGTDAAADLREYPVICSVCGQPFTP